MELAEGANPISPPSSPASDQANPDQSGAKTFLDQLTTQLEEEDPETELVWSDAPIQNQSSIPSAIPILRVLPEMVPDTELDLPIWDSIPAQDSSQPMPVEVPSAAPLADALVSAMLGTPRAEAGAPIPIEVEAGTVEHEETVTREREETVTISFEVTTEELAVIGQSEPQDHSASILGEEVESVSPPPGKAPPAEIRFKEADASERNVATEEDFPQVTAWNEDSPRKVDLTTREEPEPPRSEQELPADQGQPRSEPNGAAPWTGPEPRLLGKDEAAEISAKQSPPSTLTAESTQIRRPMPVLEAGQNLDIHVDKEHGECGSQKTDQSELSFAFGLNIEYEGTGEESLVKEAGARSHLRPVQSGPAPPVVKGSEEPLHNGTILFQEHDTAEPEQGSSSFPLDGNQTTSPHRSTSMTTLVFQEGVPKPIQSAPISLFEGSSPTASSQSAKPAENVVRTDQPPELARGVWLQQMRTSTGMVSNIRIRLAENSPQQVDVNVRGLGPEVRVSVRGGDRDLNQLLLSQAGEVVAKIERGGGRAVLFHDSAFSESDLGEHARRLPPELPNAQDGAARDFSGESGKDSQADDMWNRTMELLAQRRTSRKISWPVSWESEFAAASASR